MSIKNIVIVDTVGKEGVNEKYKANFPFVKQWFAHEATTDAGDVPHPHGGMCMQAALLPLWNDTCDIHAHFVRIFDSDGRIISQALGNWMLDTIKDISKTGPTYVNNSWGCYIANGDPKRYASSASVWRNIAKEINPTVMWAAGNTGDYDPDVDEEVPQALLTDVSSKIGAANRDGKPSSYSGDSVNAPPTAVFWSTQIHLLNPVTADWNVASGTSFAAPKATGLCAKRNLSYLDFVELAKKEGQRPSGYTGMLPHPKWGFGWLEHLYQSEIEGCPFTYTGTPRMQSAGLSWFDFELVFEDKEMLA